MNWAMIPPKSSLSDIHTLSNSSSSKHRSLFSLYKAIAIKAADQTLHLSNLVNNFAVPVLQIFTLVVTLLVSVYEWCK